MILEKERAPSENEFHKGLVFHRTVPDEGQATLSLSLLTSKAISAASSVGLTRKSSCWVMDTPFTDLASFCSLSIASLSTSSLVRTNWLSPMVLSRTSTSFTLRSETDGGVTRHARVPVGKSMVFFFPPSVNSSRLLSAKTNRPSTIPAMLSWCGLVSAVALTLRPSSFSFRAMLIRSISRCSCPKRARNLAASSSEFGTATTERLTAVLVDIATSFSRYKLPRTSWHGLPKHFGNSDYHSLFREKSQCYVRYQT